MGCGGYGCTNFANDHVQNIINQVKSEVGEQVGDLGEYRAYLYRMQIVSGMNYRIKVHLSGARFIHVHIFVAIDGKFVSLSLVETGKNFFNIL